jgi:hypothetical protein
MLIVGQLMSGIQVTVYTVQFQFLRICLIVKVCFSSFFGQSNGKKILVAFFAGFIKNNIDSIFQLLLSLPVKRFRVLKMVSIQIMESCLNLGPEVPEAAMWWQVAFSTSYPDSTFI